MKVFCSTGRSVEGFDVVDIFSTRFSIRFSKPRLKTQVRLVPKVVEGLIRGCPVRLLTIISLDTDVWCDGAAKTRLFANAFDVLIVKRVGR